MVTPSRLVSINIKRQKHYLNMNPVCSSSLLMNDTDVRFHLLHTYILKRVMLAVFSASAVSLNEDINTYEQHPQNCSESHFMSI